MIARWPLGQRLMGALALAAFLAFAALFTVSPESAIAQLTDSDGDGLSNIEEDLRNTDPNNPDTDGDGLTDFQEVDEFDTLPTKADTDEDDLNDGEEIARGTDPKLADTDGGGRFDAAEIFDDGTDPLDPTDDIGIGGQVPDGGNSTDDGNSSGDPDAIGAGVTLHTGFNEIVWGGLALPIDEALLAIDDVIVALFQWVNADQTWLTFSPLLPGPLNSLTNLAPGTIVWIVVSDTVVLPTAS